MSPNLIKQPPPPPPPTVGHLPSAHLVLSAADVRRELVAVLTEVAADVALEGLAEAVTAHVDGEHDMVQEKDGAVVAGEGAHWSAVPVQHLHCLSGRKGRTQDLLHWRGGHHTCPLPIWLQVFGLAGTGGGEAAGQCWGSVVEVVIVGGTGWGCSPCALLLCCALRVCGVRAAVG